MRYKYKEETKHFSSVQMNLSMRRCQKAFRQTAPNQTKSMQTSARYFNHNGFKIFFERASLKFCTSIFLKHSFHLNFIYVPWKCNSIETCIFLQTGFQPILPLNKLYDITWCVVGRSDVQKSYLWHFQTEWTDVYFTQCCVSINLTADHQKVV